MVMCPPKSRVAGIEGGDMEKLIAMRCAGAASKCKSGYKGDIVFNVESRQYVTEHDGQACCYEKDIHECPEATVHCCKEFTPKPQGLDIVAKQMSFFGMVLMLIFASYQVVVCFVAAVFLAAWHELRSCSRATQGYEATENEDQQEETRKAVVTKGERLITFGREFVWQLPAVVVGIALMTIGFTYNESTCADPVKGSHPMRLVMGFALWKLFWPALAFYMSLFPATLKGWHILARIVRMASDFVAAIVFFGLMMMAYLANKDACGGEEWFDIFESFLWAMLFVELALLGYQGLMFCMCEMKPTGDDDGDSAGDV